MSREELRRRVHHDVGSVLDRADEERRRDRIVDNQRDAVPLRHASDGVDVDDVVLGVRERLGEDRLRLGADQGVPFGVVRGVPDVLDGHAHAREGAVEEHARSAVDARGRDDVLAAAGETEQGDGDRRLARADDDRARTAFERRQPRFGHLVGGVGVARVEMAEIGSREPVGRLLERVEPVGGRQVHRCDARAVRQVLDLARVHLARGEAEALPIGVRGSGLSHGDRPLPSAAASRASERFRAARSAARSPRRRGCSSCWC